MKQNPKIVIYGAGAIGGSVAAWLSGGYENIYLLARGGHARAMRQKGLITFRRNHTERAVAAVRVIEDIREVPDADIVVITVKNFDLEEAAKDIRLAAGDKPVIIGMQNGLVNQVILPKYFSKVIYCIVGYNAWIEEPGVIGYQSRGPLILGTPDNSMTDEMNNIKDMFDPYVSTSVSDRFQDVAHTKLVINLSNSFTTLTGVNFTDIPDEQAGLLGKLLFNLLKEGIKVIKAAGYNEAKIGGSLTWKMISVLDKLPSFALKKLFKEFSGSFYASSMAQDIIQRGRKRSELEHLNGYLLELAEKYKVDVPVNLTVYELCREAFSKPEFKPLSVIEISKSIYGK